MPSHRMISAAWSMNTSLAFFSGSRECRGMENSTPLISRRTFTYADLIRWVNETVHELEQTPFHGGFYKIFGFGGYPCIWCEHQHYIAEEAGRVIDESFRRKCRHIDLVRPGMGRRASVFLSRSAISTGNSALFPARTGSKRSSIPIFILQGPY